MHTLNLFLRKQSDHPNGGTLYSKHVAYLLKNGNVMKDKDRLKNGSRVRRLKTKHHKN